MLAATQSVWAAAVGPDLAAAAEPVSERGGTVTVRCESSVWAEELEMMGPQLIADCASGSARRRRGS